jgi:hypothetical protein
LHTTSAVPNTHQHSVKKSVALGAFSLKKFACRADFPRKNLAHAAFFYEQKSCLSGI